MLLELRIENLLVIERAELRLGPGLNAITGETGAGKTVLAHSLDLLMGGRARAQIVRPGASEAYVEGVFELPASLFEDPQLSELAERLPDDATEIVLGRRVGASGRTSAFVQGRSATAADLQLLGGRLLAFFGQHEHRRLTLGAAQLDVLDGFIGVGQLERRASFRSAHAKVLGISRELEELRERDGARARDLDLLRYELSEIDEAAPEAGEQDGLEADRARLRNAEGLRAAAGTALAAVDGVDGEGGARGLLAEAEAALGALAGVDPEFDGLGERLGSLQVETADLAAELRSQLERADGDPQSLQAIEERLDQLARLMRKHGGSLETVLEHAEHCRAQIERLEGADERGEALDQELARASEERLQLAEQLSTNRRAAGPELEQRVAEELAQLAMEGASLEVVLEPHPREIGASGLERVELRVSTNPGMPAGALRDTASGGELSRLMLALSGLSGGGGAATIVFDEIDAGIGGGTARAVGERLRDLAGNGAQLLCITHLPQIAALATTHFRVSKRVRDEVTVADVARLEEDELVAEIRRMLGGRSDDDAATRHAEELLAA